MKSAEEKEGGREECEDERREAETRMERGGEVWEDEDTTQRATGSPENVMDSAQHKHPALSLSTEQLRTTTAFMFMMLGRGSALFINRTFIVNPH